MAKEIGFKIKIDGKELDLAKTSVDQFSQTYSDAQKKLNTLPLGSAEWKNLNGELNTAQKAFEQTKDIASTTDGKFKSLKVQIRQTTVALQEAEEKGDIKTFNKLKNDLDDLNDKFEITQLKSMKFTDALATLPGVAGLVGQSFQGLDKAFKLLVANPIIATIGALVGLFMALKESLSRTEEGTQKLAKIGEFLERVMNGLFAIIEPLANMLIDFVLGILESKEAMKVLGQVVGVTAGILAGAFNIIKTLTTFIVTNFINAFKTATGVLQGFGDVIAGVFTFDYDRIKKGVAQVRDTVVTGFNNTVDNVKDTFKSLTTGTVDAFNSAYEAAEGSFEKGFKRQTKRQKQLAKDAAEAAEKYKKAKMDEIRSNEALQQSEDELAESRRKKNEDRIAELEAQQAFIDKTYKRERKAIEDLLKVKGLTAEEEKALKVELNNLDAKYAKDSENIDNQIVTAKKERVEAVKKLAEIELQSLLNLNEKAKKERQKQFDDEKSELDKLLKEKKITQEEYDKAILQMRTKLNKDLQDIDDQAAKDELDKKLKKLDDDIKFLQIRGETLIEGTKSYYQNQRDILKKAEERELMDLKASDEFKKMSKEEQEKAITDIEAKYAKQRKDIKKAEFAATVETITATMDAIANLTSAIASSLDEESKTSKKAFEQRKKLQIATALMSAASGIIQILTQPSTIPSPFDYIVKGINAAALAVTTGVQIANIKKTQFEGGGSEGANSDLGKNYAEGGMIKGPRHAQGGTMIEAEGGEAIMTRGAVTMFGPLLSMMNQAGGGTSFNKDMLMTANDAPLTTNPSQQQSPMIMKTYVVSNELTTEAEKQARLKDLSTL